MIRGQIRLALKSSGVSGLRTALTRCGSVGLIEDLPLGLAVGLGTVAIASRQAGKSLHSLRTGSTVATQRQQGLWSSP